MIIQFIKGKTPEEQIYEKTVASRSMKIHSTSLLITKEMEVKTMLILHSVKITITKTPRDKCS